MRCSAVSGASARQSRLTSIASGCSYSRTIRSRSTAALAVVAVGAAFLTLSNNAAGHVFTASFAIGFIAFQLVANALVMDGEKDTSPLSNPRKEPAALRSLLGRTNRDWWPEMLATEILNRG